MVVHSDIGSRKKSIEKLVLNASLSNWQSILFRPLLIQCTLRMLLGSYYEFVELPSNQRG